MSQTRAVTSVASGPPLPIQILPADHSRAFIDFDILVRDPERDEFDHDAVVRTDEVERSPNQCRGLRNYAAKQPAEFTSQNVGVRHRHERWCAPPPSRLHGLVKLDLEGRTGYLTDPLVRGNREGSHNHPPHRQRPILKIAHFQDNRPRRRAADRQSPLGDAVGSSRPSVRQLDLGPVDHDTRLGLE